MSVVYQNAIKSEVNEVNKKTTVMKYEKLSNLQLEVLHVLWKSIKSQSSEEIIEQLNLGFVKSFLAEYIIEKMISKGLIIKTGEYYAKRHEDSAAE